MFFNSSAYRFPRWLILPAMAVGIFLLTELLAQHPDWVEKYYATGIYPLFATVLSSGSSLFPFSLSDIFYVVLALLPIILIVLAHEKAHQFGITSEAEANFYAWLVCSQSNSRHLRYSANLAILGYFMNHFSLGTYNKAISIFLTLKFKSYA